MPFILGVAVLILLLCGRERFLQGGPEAGCAPDTPILGGCGALVFAAFLLLRGEIGVAIPVGAIGLGLLGWASPCGRRASPGARAEEHGPGIPVVRTVHFSKWELDHDSGAMRGQILAGPACRPNALDALEPPTLIGLLSEIDPDSRDLLAAYLDRRGARLA